MENRDINYIFKETRPIRGKVTLQTSPLLTNFFITLSLIYDTNSALKGDFKDNIVQKYTDLLFSHGFSILNKRNTIYINPEYNISDTSYYSSLDINRKFLAILTLLKRGYVEIKDNKEFLDFLGYMGFSIERKKEFSTVFNKTELERNSITFYEINTEYFLISILVFLLNYNQFTISISDTTYEINLLIEELKRLDLVKSVNYSKYVQIKFDSTNLKSNLNNGVKIPKDSKEIIFFSVLSLLTSGEIEIEGINPKYIANSLKIFSEIGAGYDSISSGTLRIWGSKYENYKNINIDDDISYLEFTKICLLPLLCQISKDKNINSIISTETRKYRSLLQDLNRFGASIQVTDGSFYSRESVRLKGDKLYLEENKEEENYVRILLAIASSEEVTVSNYNYFYPYNSTLIGNLKRIGCMIEKV